MSINNKIQDIEGLFFKREDLSPSGSFKDRLINYIWQNIESIPEKEIVVSSSGNLAISLLYFQKHHSLDKKITVFIKDNLPEIKLSKLKSLAAQDCEKVELKISKKPKSDAVKYARENNAYFLRNSTGKDYPKAYEPMADEIIEYEEENDIKFSDIYICASSATAAIGMMQRLLKLGRKIPVYLVQTSHIHSIAKEFDQDFEYEEDTRANAIADRVAKRKSRAIELVKALNGGAVVCDNAQIAEATKLLNKMITDKKFTGNAALSLAGFKKRSLHSEAKNSLIIISGN
jgi:threonine dehydratase